jgi:hypothetical protein
LTKSVTFQRVTCLFLFALATSCGRRAEIQTLEVNQGRKFESLRFKKVFQVDLYGGWCLALPRGFICSELLDRSYKESQLRLYDESGKVIKERRLVHGDGPGEIKVWNFNNVWLFSSGKILTEDNHYLKSLDPETLEIETICKLSNVIEGYGSKFTLGWNSFTSLEEDDGHVVTSLESSAYYEDITYFIVTCDAGFKNLSVLAKAKKPKPLVWAKLEERKKNMGKLESITDYYHIARMTRMLSADWRRQVVYFFSDIDESVMESVSFDGKVRKRYRIDIRSDNFPVEREEFDFYHEYAASDTDPRLKGRFSETLYIPPHAPALMGLKVMGDRLFVITGNRNWEKKENEVLVYSLPSRQYEGGFFIPFPNLLLTQWYDDYYITRTLAKKGDDYYSSYEIYRVESSNIHEGNPH